MEELELVLDMAKDGMKGALAHLENELTKIRAGKATPSLLDSVVVEYYGSNVPLSQVANVNTIDARTLTVQPWEKSMLGEIEKKIIAANLGLNPQNNGDIIMINVPPLTEERRRNLVKQVKTEGENAKISIRSARRDANEEIKKLNKDGLPDDLTKKAEESVQKITDDYIAKTDALIAAKEKDIMTV